MNLTVDIGNTFIKMAVFEGEQIIDTFRTHGYEPDALDAIFDDYPAIDKAILVDGRGELEALEIQIRARVKTFIRFDGNVPVPVVNKYATPETLGYDRLADAVGAHAIYPNNPVLVVDFGTAITYDVVTAAGEYLGGNISPGAGIRFRALNEFTRSLPLGKLPEGEEFTGNCTANAVENGVAMGILLETEGYIDALQKKFNGLKTIFTGGDANYFAKRVKKTIFATSDLVFYGLNAILEYNAN